MDTSTTYRDNDDRSTETMTTVAAVFADHERAHDAVHQLHQDGFRDTWIGRTKYDDRAAYDETLDAPTLRDERATADASAPVAGALPRTPAYGDAAVAPTYGQMPAAAYSETPAAPAAVGLSAAPVYGETPAVYGDESGLSGETRVESDNWFMRLFGEGDESLHDALVRHGVSEADARRAGALPPHSAIVTVDGANHPELAAQIMSDAGGRLITAGYDRSDRYAYDANLDAGRAANSSDADRERAAERYAGVSDATAYDELGTFRGGVPVDESTRMQLREERLRTDKSRVTGGTEELGSDALSTPSDRNRAVVREDFFVERRQAANEDRRDTQLGVMQPGDRR